MGAFVSGGMPPTHERCRWSRRIRSPTRRDEGDMSICYLLSASYNANALTSPTSATHALCHNSPLISARIISPFSNLGTFARDHQRNNIVYSIAHFNLLNIFRTFRSLFCIKPLSLQTMVMSRLTISPIHGAIDKRGLTNTVHLEPARRNHTDYTTADD